MKPFSVRQIRTILAGDLVQGTDDMIVRYGAYRLKQIKEPNTMLFLKKKIMSFNDLKPYFPLVIVANAEHSDYDFVEGLTVIQVKDIEDAYWKFVHHYRNLFKLPVIAITGTSGKTTTKEMIRHILSKDKTIASTNSTNNSRTAHLQYLLSIDENTEAAVFETAVGAPGDVLNAGIYFKPTIGIITNIGAHHLNYCKTIDAYIEAKGEIAAALNNKGVLIVNAEDQNTKKLNLDDYQGRLIKVGIGDSCHFRASNIQYTINGMIFVLRHLHESHNVEVPGVGEHQVYNALAAIAAVYEVGVSIPEAAKRLATFKNFNKHLQIVEGINDSILIDDTWSMTTTSLEAALKVLNDLGRRKKKIAIIGTITDLGSWGYVIHEFAGELISQIGVDVLITIGMHATLMAEYVKKKGSPIQVYSFGNNTLVYGLLDRIVDENSVVLIKGDMYSKAIVELAHNLRKKK